MVKRRWLALLLVLLMGISLISGCSPAEKSYYSLMREVNTQPVYIDNGHYTIDVSALPAGMFTGCYCQPIMSGDRRRMLSES